MSLLGYWPLMIHSRCWTIPYEVSRGSDRSDVGGMPYNNDAVKFLKLF
jgi:hypothetical protein